MQRMHNKELEPQIKQKGMDTIHSHCQDMPLRGIIITSCDSRSSLALLREVVDSTVLVAGKLVASVGAENVTQNNERLMQRFTS